jgi:aminoglycoside phosphotransferase (APT) family kinase protein
VTVIESLDARFDLLLAEAGLADPDRPALKSETFGCDNTVYATVLAGQDVLVKARKGQGDRYALAAWAAERLAGLGLPAPRILAHGNGLSVETRCSGDSLERDPHPGIAATAGRALRRLHQEPAPGFGRLTPDGHCAKHATLDAWLLDLQPQGGLEQGIVAAVAAHRHLLDCSQPRLLHGDWATRHVFHDRHQLTGIIDLESVRGGDPLADVAGWTLDAAPDIADAFLEGYFSGPPNAAQHLAIALHRLRIAIFIRRWRAAENDRMRLAVVDRAIAADLGRISEP